MNGNVLTGGIAAAQQEGLMDKHILGKTCYGLDLLSHIVHLDHTVSEGLRVSIPDCGYWPNPFDGYRRTLHVTVIKEEPDASPSDYVARYHDESGTIPDGDAIDFAGHFWGIQGQPLLEKINHDLYLRIGEEFNFYDMRVSANVDTTSSDEPQILYDVPDTAHVTSQELSSIESDATAMPSVTVTEPPRFSFFHRPIRNVTPDREISLTELYDMVVSGYAKESTGRLRAIANKDEAKTFKGNSFDYVTPAGIFAKRANSELVSPSGLIVIDIDDLRDTDEVESTFQLLLNNPRLETQLLFRSPGGLGLKWFVPIVNNEGHDHRFYFQAVANYLNNYGIVVDPSGKDVSRACFVPYDPAAYINPMYLF